MAKYGKKAEETIASAMHRYKKGTLRSGSGDKVKSREQAIAIGMSEARSKGAKVPPEKPHSGTRARKSAPSRKHK